MDQYPGTVTRVRTGYYTVVADYDMVKAEALQSHVAAQEAKLCTLIEACKLSAAQSVTIYMDSRYAFGVVHNFVAIWKHRNALTSSRRYIAHHKPMSERLDAVQLPLAIAVCKCCAQTNKSDPVSLGNTRADSAAKQATRGKIFTEFCCV